MFLYVSVQFIPSIWPLPSAAFLNLVFDSPILSHRCVKQLLRQLTFTDEFTYKVNMNEKQNKIEQKFSCYKHFICELSQQSAHYFNFQTNSRGIFVVFSRIKEQLIITFLQMNSIFVFAHTFCV